MGPDGGYWPGEAGGGPLEVRYPMRLVRGANLVSSG